MAGKQVVLQAPGQGQGPLPCATCPLPSQGPFLSRDAGKGSNIVLDDASEGQERGHWPGTMYC